MASCRTSGQSAACCGDGRSQLRSQAFQASCKASASKPGSSDQRTGCQRLRPCTMARGKGAASAGSSGGWTAGAGAAGSRDGGALEQAASIPTMAARRIRRMLVILLEALLALLLLVGIVWWTMFSGRKDGELPDDEDRER